MSPLVEMISAMLGYAAVQSWFVQVVSALTKYITLDAGHSVNARLKVKSPTKGLHLESQGSTHYLGHAGDAVTPYMFSVHSAADAFWSRIDIKQQSVLFEPKTYRSPVIRGSSNDKSGDWSSTYDAYFAKVEWNIVAPFNKAVSLQASSCHHDADRRSWYTALESSFVQFRTKAPAAQATAGSQVVTPPQAHMIVFRNAQGQFLPAMSDRAEFQYWRKIKVGATKTGEHIKG